MVSWQEVRDEIIQLHNQRVDAIIRLASDPLRRYRPSSDDHRGWAEDLRYDLKSAKEDGYTMTDGRVYLPTSKAA